MNAQERLESDQALRTMSEADFQKYHASITRFIIEQIQAVQRLTTDFKEAFAESATLDNAFLKTACTIWLNEIIETLKAILLLQQNGFRVQSLSLARGIIEIYFTLVWLYEKGNPNARLALLNYRNFKTKLKNFEKNKAEGEIELLNEKVVEAQEVIKKHLKILLEGYPTEFPDEKSVKEALKKIRSYPQIDDANKSDAYQENEFLYDVLSGATHAKDLTPRVGVYTENPLSIEEQFSVFFDENLSLLKALYAVAHIQDFLAEKTKTAIDTESFRARWTSFLSNRDSFIFYRP